MKRKIIVGIWNAFHNAGEFGGNAKHSIWVSKNKILIKDEISIIEDAQKLDLKFIEYSQKIDELKRSNIVDADLYYKKFEDLNSEYKDTIDNRKKQLIDLENILEEEVEIDITKFHKIKEADLHKDLKGNDDFILRSNGLIIE